MIKLISFPLYALFSGSFVKARRNIRRHLLEVLKELDIRETSLPAIFLEA